MMTLTHGLVQPPRITRYRRRHVGQRSNHHHSVPQKRFCRASVGGYMRVPAHPAIRGRMSQISWRTTGALLVEDLLPDDVGVPAVLGEFAQHVEVHPAKREWPEPVAVDLVV